MTSLLSHTRADDQNPTPLAFKQLDRAAFADSFAGHETPIPAERAKDGPREVIWTKEQGTEWSGVEFGMQKEPGTRHLRIGFTEQVAIGSILVRGGGTLSVLKADATYPGDLANDSQWLTAERLNSQQPVGREEVVLWTLPRGTSTRALRFTHTAEAADQNPAGWLGGAWLLGERAINVAPQATSLASAKAEKSFQLNDQSINGLWGAWDNGEQGGALAISSQNPETITLTWPKPVKIDRVGLIWAGFSTAEVEALVGPTDLTPTTAPRNAWQKVAVSNKIAALYPLALAPNWLDFEKTIETRSIRIRIVAPMKLPVPHSHLEGKTNDGKRVWLGEVVALSPLGDMPLPQADASLAEQKAPPPIAVKFHLDEPGLVTLVIEDEQGRRVRNLVSETPYPAGENIAYWDGSDDLLRDDDAAKHGLYHIPTRFVEPGRYSGRGLWRKPLKLLYEQSVYTAGKPAWETADKTGAWMTNHTPPTSIACVPAGRAKDGKPLVFMGAFVAEGGHGLQWILEDGTKIGGQGWVGGTWTGAPTLAVDGGAKAIADHLCYAASIWEGELRLTAKSQDLQDRAVLKHRLGDDPPPDRIADEAQRPTNLVDFDGGDRKFVLAGIAANDGVVVCSLIRQNELLLVDVAASKELSRLQVNNPRGLAFDAKGRLLVLSGNRLLRFDAFDSPPKIVIKAGLDDPRHIALDAIGNLYITDQGESHQVKVFSSEGELMRVIGKPGVPAIGIYDPLHMNHPNGLGVDSQGRVWVAENDFHPKRISLWSPEGRFTRGFYGPGEYGGGGTLDSQDKSRFFYKGQEFKLDWKSGVDELVRVFYRPTPLMEAHYGPYSPDTPLYPTARSGHRYFTSCYTHIPTGGDHAVFIWHDDQPNARLVAGFGNAHAWKILKSEPFRAGWPEGLDPLGPEHQNSASFSWSDADGDGLPQPGEVKVRKGSCYGITTEPDLSLTVARFDDQTVSFAPAGYNKHDAPIYDLASPTLLADGAQSPTSSGGDQALHEMSGWTIHTNVPKPYSPNGLGGTFRGEPRWSYPSVWPGLHASHEAAVPDRPGMVIGTTRLLGGWIKPKGEAGAMFGINANMGNMYLFTADGLFVATLFNDIRLRPNWSMPTAKRGMDVSNVSLHDENFWPSMTQTADGNVYVVDGARVSVVRVDGLDSIRRIQGAPIDVTAKDIDLARDWLVQAEAQRQASEGGGNLKVVFRETSPTVDGKLDDWPATTTWATIDRRGTAANFDSAARPYNAAAAVAISGEKAFVAWRTTEKELLRNSGETPEALFKNGGCLDLMLGADGTANADRKEPVPGDLRLLVTMVKDKPRAALYRARVPGTKHPIGFSSPWRTVTFDAVDDVSGAISLASGGDGNFEISIPLATLGWSAQAGKTYRADLGVLRGDGRQTTQRVYWSNKATAITADVPSEAELAPSLWGTWEIIGETK